MNSWAFILLAIVGGMVLIATIVVAVSSRSLDMWPAGLFAVLLLVGPWVRADNGADPQ
jgi:hypothetical protein